MVDRVVLDSSVIAAIFFPEETSERAEEFAKESHVITVDLSIIEVANVAWKRYRFFGENRMIVEEALKSCREFIRDVCEVVQSNELLEEAFNIAVDVDITVYDALFVVASKRKSARLVTSDRKLFEKAKHIVEVELI